MSIDAFTVAAEAAEELRARTSSGSFDVAVVMGSGWVPAADALGEPVAEFPVTDLPGFARPAVEGHAGRVRVVETAGRRVLVLLGRTHLYEGHGVDAVVHPIRTALAAGVGTVVLTNAAGGLRPEHQQVGDPVLIADHLNLSGANPLTGATFLDLTEAYSGRLRALAKEADPDLSEGVYAALRGPSYETPAEIRMLRTLGADMVGMSTVLETIEARRGGAEVLGISLVTNIAAGLAAEPLDHQEVLAAGRASAGRMGSLLATLVPRL
ncbi:purine-nucleoside phosphorylase [Actinomadura pelletieri DSM 43383]|uniref:Purine nucleoside phosphorylase n=1 Tax=Actinomadura pelletieri DSM 43383 TaxID=1120940 RepID=A0A495QS34_9ACTN|nr:purine-nucleoside phosphorylase [Actinomadura pelletieri]RKS76277.1 purine-nucleoside phosphorylase [Actinomadura pelletieri DSM 43383]